MSRPISRFAVTGGRDYDDGQVVGRVLRQLPLSATLVHGDAPGADRLAACTWRRLGGQAEAHRARWSTEGRAAGVLRNQRMLDSGLDLLVAFPGGRGTADMTERCRVAGVPILFALPWLGIEVAA